MLAANQHAQLIRWTGQRRAEESCDRDMGAGGGLFQVQSEQRNSLQLLDLSRTLWQLLLLTDNRPEVSGVLLFPQSKVKKRTSPSNPHTTLCLHVSLSIRNTHIQVVETYISS